MRERKKKDAREVSEKNKMKKREYGHSTTQQFSQLSREVEVGDFFTHTHTSTLDDFLFEPDEKKNIEKKSR